MNDFVLNGLNVQFDIGTLRMIAAETGKDPLNPLEGIDVLSQAVYIILCGTRRYDSSKGTQFSAFAGFIDALSFIDNCTPDQVVQIIRCFSKAIEVKSQNIDPGFLPANGEQEKKIPDSAIS